MRAIVVSRDKFLDFSTFLFIIAWLTWDVIHFCPNVSRTAWRCRDVSRAAQYSRTTVHHVHILHTARVKWNSLAYHLKRVRSRNAVHLQAGEQFPRPHKESRLICKCQQDQKYHSVAFWCQSSRPSVQLNSPVRMYIFNAMLLVLYDFYSWAYGLQLLNVMSTPRRLCSHRKELFPIRSKMCLPSKTDNFPSE